MKVEGDVGDVGDVDPKPESVTDDQPVPLSVPIVGIGASAGGLAALEAFFDAMPPTTDTGMAFVVVQHLSPDHKSMLSELIGRRTGMRVCQVRDGMKVEPNCVYVIAPRQDLALCAGTLELLQPTLRGALHLPVDTFFESLAAEQGERAVGIILSGTGSDGVAGIQAINAAGGLVIAQDPESTEYSGMPASAIATGRVDYVLQPADMPEHLIAHAPHAAGRRPLPSDGGLVLSGDQLKKTCLLVRAQTGHDFSQYKSKTLVRRVERRMAIHQIDRPDEFVRFLQSDTREVEALFRDLLIGVTCFFRDPEAFDFVERHVIPRLFANKPAGGESDGACPLRRTARENQRRDDHREPGGAARGAGLEQHGRALLGPARGGSDNGR